MFKTQNYTTFTSFPWEDILLGIGDRNSNFPFYNIVQLSEGAVALEIGLAGYRKEDIKVQQEGSKLTVSSEGATGLIGNSLEYSDVELKYNKQTLASRSFNLSFQLNNYAEVRKVKMDNGVLVIKLAVPEEKKAKTLDIS